jgi:hypothetical protein
LIKRKKRKGIRVTRRDRRTYADKERKKLAVSLFHNVVRKEGSKGETINVHRCVRERRRRTATGWGGKKGRFATLENNEINYLSRLLPLLCCMPHAARYNFFQAFLTAREATLHFAFGNSDFNY